MKSLLKFVLFICLCLFCLSSCRTSHHAGKHNKKKNKKGCNCPQFSYADTYPENTYVLKTN